MIVPDYEVGQYVRLKPFQSGAKAVRCVCKPDKESVVKPLDITAPELGGCWHGPKTTVLRVFASGDYLLKNRHGFVRLARPDEVCR
jgi:hypothetical protein